jgi:hypothetical protein
MTLETLAPLRDDEIVGLRLIDKADASDRGVPLQPHHATGHYPSCMRHLGCRFTEDPDRM